ncbi:MAG: ribosome small subunit-dependent GTPase A [Micropepsaceae bacterium]
MNNLTLQQLGWNAHFQSQLTEQELTLPVARVFAVHRDALEVRAPGFESRATPPLPDDDGTPAATVGDWLLLDDTRKRVHRVLERKSLFQRRRAGTDRGIQLLAANVDTLLIATSANNDFNIARLERYLALASEAEVTPVILITKADLVSDIAPYLEQARRLLPNLVVEAIDARSPEILTLLSPLFSKGQTIALLGSSGVGKSTIVNTLRGDTLQETRAIREDDSRGRHTTTGRTMHLLPSGAWLVDTPGMRELQMVNAESGVQEVFADIVEIAALCKFTNCKHESEPQCAIRAAIEDGTLDEQRLKRFRKLQREDNRNSESIAEAHERSQKFGRMAKRTFIEKLKKREW